MKRLLARLLLLRPRIMGRNHAMRVLLEKSKKSVEVK